MDRAAGDGRFCTIWMMNGGRRNTSLRYKESAGEVINKNIMQVAGAALVRAPPAMGARVEPFRANELARRARSCCIGASRALMAIRWAPEVSPI